MKHLSTVYVFDQLKNKEINLLLLKIVGSAVFHLELFSCVRVLNKIKNASSHVVRFASANVIKCERHFWFVYILTKMTEALGKL